MQLTPPTTTPINVVGMRHNGHTWLVLYEDGQEHAAYCKLWKWFLTPWLPFTWRMAAQMAEEIQKHELENERRID